MTQKLHGLVAATHTPFHADGSLNINAIEAQAGHLYRDGVKAVFVGGTTGESSSLSVEERIALAGRWAEVVRGTGQKLIVHVGANCLADAKTLAGHAYKIGAFATAALSPSYFKPKSVGVLVECCAEIAAAAPALPFYFYDIPSMTGVSFPMPEFLALAGKRIPNLAGIKFTNSDLMALQNCLRAADGRFDIPFGMDECLLAALALGAIGGVGSSYNFAAPLYHRIIAAFETGDLETARREQFRSVQLIELVAKSGYMAAAKATMGFMSVDVGPPRLPNANLSDTERGQLRDALDHLGYFQWGR